MCPSCRLSSEYALAFYRFVVCVSRSVIIRTQQYFCLFLSFSVPLVFSVFPVGYPSSGMSITSNLPVVYKDVKFRRYHHSLSFFLPRQSESILSKIQHHVLRSTDPFDYFFYSKLKVYPPFIFYLFFTTAPVVRQSILGFHYRLCYKLRPQGTLARVSKFHGRFIQGINTLETGSILLQSVQEYIPSLLQHPLFKLFLQYDFLLYTERILWQFLPHLVW